MLEPRHERHAADRRLQRVEGGPDAAVADRVDDRRDPGAGGARRERGEPLRRRDEDPALRAGGQRLAGLRLDRLEEGRRPRRERPVGEELQPAEPGPVDARPERIAAPQARLDRRVDLLLADAGVDAERQAAALREAPVRLDPAPEPLLQRQRARVVDRDDAEPTSSLGERGDEPLVALVGWARGTWFVTSRAAASWRTPVGSPPSSRRMIPPAGSVGVACDPRPSRAPPGSPRARGGRGPTARPAARARRRSRSSAVGQRPQRSESQPWPSIQSSGAEPLVRGARSAPGRPRATAPATGRRSRARSRPRRGGGGSRSGPGSRPRPGRARSGR